jgi:hypothetical protein
MDLAARSVFFLYVEMSVPAFIFEISMICAD